MSTGDFQARFRGNVRVKFPCVTRLGSTPLSHYRRLNDVIIAN
jgi:hypothetical protein